MIKSFSQFINESADSDMAVNDLLGALTRNYETKKMFYTDLVQFKVIEERRDWGDIRQKAQLEKSRTDDGYYKLVFDLDEKNYKLEINFSLTYVGKKEKDAPETASETDLERLNTTIENVKIKKISIESQSLNYKSSSPSDSVEKSCMKFLLKMLSLDYDSLGSEIYDLEQG